MSASFQYQRGQVNTLMLTVLNLAGGIPTYPTDYATPQVKVTHLNSSNAEIVDINFTNMTHVTGTNRWFYNFIIPINADFTKYVATFNSTVQTISITTTEEFQVVSSLLGIDSFSLADSCKNNIISNLKVNILDEVLITDHLNQNFSARQGNWLSSPIPKITSTDSSGVETLLFDSVDYISDFTLGQIAFPSATTKTIKASYTYFPWNSQQYLAVVDLAINEIGTLIWRKVDQNNISVDYKSPICRRIYTKLLEDLLGESKDFFNVSVAGRNIAKASITSQINLVIDQNEKQLLTLIEPLRFFNKTSKILPLYTSVQTIASNAKVV